MIVSLAQARAQCRIDGDITDEDSLLTGLIEAAHDAAQNYTDRAIFATQEGLAAAVETNPETRHPIVATAAIKQAMLLLIGHWYMSRETAVVGVSVTSLPAAHEYLLHPYRVMSDA